MSIGRAAGDELGIGPRAIVATQADDALPDQALALGEGAPGRRRGQQIGTHMIVFNLVLTGLAITLEPIPLTAFILVLASKGGVRKGAAFIFGWLLSLAIVIAVTVLVTGNNPPKPSTAPSLAALAAKLAIGVGLLVIAIRHYRKWSLALVDEILSNPKYTGHQVMGRRRRKGGKKVRMPASEWIWTPEPTHPALVDKATWGKAQRMGRRHGNVRDPEMPTWRTGRHHKFRSRLLYLPPPPQRHHHPQHHLLPVPPRARQPPPLRRLPQPPHRQRR